VDSPIIQASDSDTRSKTEVDTPKIQTTDKTEHAETEPSIHNTSSSSVPASSRDVSAKTDQDSVVYTSMAVDLPACKAAQCSFRDAAVFPKQPPIFSKSWQASMVTDGSEGCLTTDHSDVSLHILNGAVETKTTFYAAVSTDLTLVREVLELDDSETIVSPAA
jgi:hypothetical protein